MCQTSDPAEQFLLYKSHPAINVQTRPLRGHDWYVWTVNYESTDESRR